MTTPPKPRKRKKTKEAVHFRMARPNGPRCGTCTMFRPATLTCTDVLGRIRKGDLCDEYVEKK